eukprot:2984185-Lingulodinium_polyedra.AAC.1
MRECDDMVQYKRVCPSRKLDTRKEEFEKWSDETKQQFPEYATKRRVMKDLMWPRIPTAPKKRRTPRLKKSREMWKKRKQKRLT